MEKNNKSNEKELINLTPGAIITYSNRALHFSPAQLSRGRIIHIGKGLAARHAVFVVVLDGRYAGEITCVLVDWIVAVQAPGEEPAAQSS